MKPKRSVRRPIWDRVEPKTPKNGRCRRVKWAWCAPNWAVRGRRWRRCGARFGSPLRPTGCAAVLFITLRRPLSVRSGGVGSGGVVGCTHSTMRQATPRLCSPHWRRRRWSAAQVRSVTPRRCARTSPRALWMHSGTHARSHARAHVRAHTHVHGATTLTLALTPSGHAVMPRP